MLRGFTHPVLIAFASVMLVVAMAITYAMNASHDQIIEYEAVRIAEVAARQVVAARTVYSRDAVAKLKADGTGSDAHADQHKGFVPLPAQFLRLLGREATQVSGGLYQIQLVSKWNLAPEQHLQDAFQRRGWARLEAQESAAGAGQPVRWQPVWDIQSVDGIRTLRYLRADPAESEGCVQCHNAYEQTAAVRAMRMAQGLQPGRVWRVEQLLGAIEVRVPLDRIEAIADGQTGRTIVMVIAIAGLGLMVAAIFAMKDIRHRERLARQFKRQANFDLLTGLPNRALFARRVEKAIAHCKRRQTRFAILFIDIDRFKTINDSLGHSVGDQVLRHIARRLVRSLKPGDVAARYSGDEFTVLLLDGDDDAEIDGRVARLLATLGAPIEVDGRRLDTTASIGLSTYPSDGNNLEDLIRRADAAMYRAKDGGRNACTRYEASIGAAAVAALTLASELRTAFELGQFELHYQPRFNMNDGRVRAVEALIRWRHPRRGLVPPARFLEAIDQLGLTSRLGQWVLGEALRQRRAWSQAGYPDFRVAVNVSPLQFQSAGFVRMVVDSLRSSGVPPGQLELEITEGTLMHESDRVAHALTTLSRFGVTLAIDDFGTGYSSLSYLKRFPIDTVKIDKSFVAGLPDDANDRTLTNAIIGLAHSLNLRVVAEGVETGAQLKFLAQSRCEEVQGYLLARPVAPEQLADLLRAGGTSMEPGLNDNGPARAGPLVERITASSDA